ncbi:MAG: S8 family serine peptidase [Candidatus Coatesbacteria bacterium]
MLTAVLVVAGPAAAKRVPDEVMVRFRPGAAAEDVRRAAAGIGARVADEIPRLRVRLLKLPPGLDVDEAIDRLRRNPNVELAEPNQLFRRKGLPNDPRLNWQWGLEQIGATLAWGLTVTGAQGSPDVLIAVVDSGILSAHPDLAGKVVAGYDTITGGGNGDPDPGPGNGHGTFVASIAAAVSDNGIGMAGTAQRARLLAVKLYETGSWDASEFMIVKGVTWAVDHGAKVINMSLGSCFQLTATVVECGSPTVIGADAARDAWERGAVLVASAGNESTTQFSYPAAYPHVLGVAATNRADLPTVYTNYGGYIDVAAPGGESFLLCDPTDDIIGATSDPAEACPALGFSPSDFTTAAGTSMSAPFVAGLAAVLFGADPSRTNAEVAGLIRASADQPLGATGWNDLYGYGRINMYRALRSSAPGSLAALEVSAGITPARPQPGDAVTVVVGLRNSGTEPAGEPDAALEVSGGIDRVALEAAPAGSATTALGAGETRSWAWTFRAVSPGPVSFSAVASAVDGVTGRGLTARRDSAVVVAATRAAEGGALVPYPNPVAGDEFRLAVPLESDAAELTVFVHGAASMEPVYRATWHDLLRAEGGVVVRGVRGWAPGLYLVRARAKLAGGTTRDFAAVKVMVKR